MPKERLYTLWIAAIKKSPWETQYFVKHKCGVPASNIQAGNKIRGKAPVLYTFPDGSSFEKMLEIEQVLYRGTVYPKETVIQEWNYCIKTGTNPRDDCVIYILVFINYELTEIIRTPEKGSKTVLPLHP